MSSIAAKSILDVYLPIQSQHGENAINKNALIDYRKRVKEKNKMGKQISKPQDDV